MKLRVFNQITPTFKGRREDRNTVKQLKQDNDYSLTENNKIRINKAIDNLSKESSETNIKFLLDVAENLKYGTNINNGKEPEINWKDRLHDATKKSIAYSNPIIQQKYKPELDRVFVAKKALTNDEKEILKSRDSILSRLDMSQLADEKNPNIKRAQSNLDYFIASSDTPTKQKKYVLNRLDYFLSPEYKINPQLKNKKTKVFAEMINDLVVNTKESKVPNTKAINQKHHGMCAAISISRKLMSYEDKPNYVDNLLSELDDSNYIMVYDKTQIGKGKRVPVEKTYVDFEDAEKKGYRITDASTTQWMHIAGMYNSNSNSKYYYVPFDRENFGTFSDTHLLLPIEDEKLKSKNLYYQALMQSKEAIGSAKKMNITKNVNSQEIRMNKEKDLAYLNNIHKDIKSILKTIIPDMSDKEAHQTLGQLKSLRKGTSDEISKSKSNLKKYSFIPNEEAKMKDAKIKAFLNDSFKERIDSKMLGNNATNIKDLVETSIDIQNSINPKSTLSSKIADSRKSFEAAAAYRNHVVFALQDEDYKTDYMIKHNIPDTETLLAENLNKVVDKVTKKGDARYINHFATVLGIEPDKEVVGEVVSSIRDGVNESLTKGLDTLYTSLGFEGGRKGILLSEVSGLKSAMEDGDKETIKDSSFALGFKEPDKNKAIKEYSKFEQILTKGASEKEYLDIFNKLGYKNQLKTFADVYTDVMNALVEPEKTENQIIVESFNLANNIPEGSSIDVSREKLMQIGQSFNQMSQNVSFTRELMDIIDEKDVLINSAKASNIIMKKLEDKGEVIPARELEPLRDRFDKIDKLRSQDEFSSRQGKISEPSLYKLTSGEKQTIKKINKSLDRMYSDVNKEMAFVMTEIRKPLEEHTRKMGVEMGDYWVSLQSHGMSGEQEVKILQQMTDKPYRKISSMEKGIDKIKNTPYSGVSTSSVFHDKLGMHAQYVAEVSPHNKNNKDVLYNDNSWGASELENTWFDSEDVMHTDYSDHRGGPTGYITNDKYRNGNYVNDILNNGYKVVEEPIKNKQLKKLSKDNYDGYEFNMYTGLIMQGTDGRVKEIAGGIKDNVFIPELEYLENFTKQASNMTQAHMKNLFKKNVNAGTSYHKKLEDLEKRIYTTTFNKGIVSQADYDVLPDNDPIKLNFEKVALSRSFPDAVDWKKLAKADSLKQVEEFKKERYKNAKEYFDYSFGKDEKVLYAYALNKKVNKAYTIIDNALTNHNIQIDDKQKIEILKNSAVFMGDEKKQFDGSLKNTIGFMVNKTLRQFDTVVSDSENARLAKKEIKENLTKSLSDELYFNISDVDNKSTKFLAISKYIDKKYNPETNEDFVNIYRNLQDMTTEEFNKETADIKEEDLAIKNLTGYDMLRLYKAHDSKTKTTLRNIMFQHELLKDIELSKTKPSYKYHKLYKNSQGATYVNGRTFDDLYRDYAFTLQTLDYSKMFNKHKDSAFRDHSVFPAYPVVPAVDDDSFDQKAQHIDELVFEKLDDIKARQNTIKLYDIEEKMDSIISNLPDNSKVPAKQMKRINNLAGDFITLTYSDNTLQKTKNSAMSILELDKNATGKEYKQAFYDMKLETEALKQMNSKDTLEVGIKVTAIGLDKILSTIIQGDIQERYRNDVKQDFNSWLKEEMKGDKGDLLLDKKLGHFSDNLDAYSMNKKNYNVTKKEYMNNLEFALGDIATAKTATKLFNDAKIKSGDSLNNAIADFVEESIPESDKHDFIEVVNSLANSETKLKKDDVNKILTMGLSKIFDVESRAVIDSNDTEILTKAILAYNKDNINTIKAANNIKKNVDIVLSSSNKFIDGNIKPEYRQNAKNSVGDLVNIVLKEKHPKYDEVKAAEAHEKFISNFKKYHILNNPIEALNGYLLLSASDSPLKILDEKKDAEKLERLKNEYKVKKGSLNSAMSVAKLNEMQDMLMEAVQTGNAAAVANKFSDYNTGLFDPKTGSVISMNDDLAIDYIVKSLIIGDNDDTAVMFVDKLGLANKFLRAQNQIFDLNDAKSDVDEIVKILGTASAQTNIVQDEMKIFKQPEFENDEDYTIKIDNAKNNIIKKTKGMSMKPAVKRYLKALDDAKKVIDANPNLSKIAIVFQSMNQALAEVTDTVNDDVQDIQKNLNSIIIVHKFANKLNIPENSDAKAELEKYNAKYDEFEKYNNEQLVSAMNSGNSEFISISYKNS